MEKYIRLKLIALIVVVLTVGLIPAWVQYGCFMLNADFMNQQIPFIIETKRMLSSDAPFWSWNTYFGDNFIASYSFYTLTSPFVWLNCLFPVSWMCYSITLTLYLKFIVLGLLCYQFFLKYGISKQNSLLATLMFVFSSYVIIDLGYYHFMEPIICFVLLLYAIEKYINEERYAGCMLGIVSFCVVFVNFYFAPCSFIPALIYFVFRTIEKRKNSVQMYMRALFFVMLGVTASSVVLLPTVIHMVGSVRTGASLFSGYYWEDRIFSLFSPKLRDGRVPLVAFSGWTSTAVNIPVVGCLLAALFMLDKRKSALSCVIVSLLVCYLTPLNGMFSMFTDSSYTRWVYALVFFIVVATAKFLDSQRSVSKQTLVIYTALCFAVVLLRYAIPITWHLYRSVPFVDDELVFTVIQIMLVVFSLVLLCLFLNSSSFVKRVFYVILFSSCHLLIFTFIRSDAYAETFGGEKIKLHVFNRYVKNNDFPYKEKEVGYRTDFVTRSQPYYVNVALLKNTPSVQTYNSVRNKCLSDFFLIADSVKNRKQNSFQYNIYPTSFDALMSVKTVVKYKDPESKISVPDGLTLIAEKKRYEVYESEYYIPFGFTYDRYILQSEVDSVLMKSSVDIPKMLLCSMAIEEKDEKMFARYLTHSLGKENEDLETIVHYRRRNACTDQIFTTRGFSCVSSLRSDAPLFFSVPADKGFTATVDGKEVPIYKVNCGMSAIIAPSGVHKIQFDFVPVGLKLGGIISAISIFVLLMCAIYERRRKTLKIV